MIKKNVRGEHSINTGVLTEYEIDLGKSQGFPGGSLVADMLGYTKASVTVTGVGATGTAGMAEIEQSNDKVSHGFLLDVPKDIEFTPNLTKGTFNIDITAQYLVINTSAVVWGVVGKVIIKIVTKR